MGIDLYKDKIEIACFAHAVNGGIKIDPTACSSIPGLYAARRGGRPVLTAPTAWAGT